MSAVYLLKASGPFNYLNVYGFESNSLKKVYKLRSDNIFMFCKNIHVEGGDNLAAILYVNNGGSMSEGYLKYKDMKKEGSIFKKGSKIYFKKLTKQVDNFSSSGIVFSRRDLEILLSVVGEKNYNNCYDVIVNRLIAEVQKKKSDYEKLYSYWRNNCYSHYNFYRLEQGDQFVDVRIDYEGIKKSKEKINKEIVRMFALFKKIE